MNSRFWTGRHVLVTGGAGFIGSHLVRHLARGVAHLRVVDNLERGRRESLDPVRDAVELVVADLREPGVADAACRDVDVVFHLAAKVGGIRIYQQAAYEVAAANARIDVAVLEACHTAAVAGLVYASSAHVYPAHLQMRPDAPALKEDDALPAAPSLTYGWVKLFTEQLLAALAGGQGRPPRTCALRICGAYGPGQSDDLVAGSAIPVFIRRAIAWPGEAPFRVLGTGAETRSYCYVDDVVEALVRAGEVVLERGSLPPINIGSEGRITIGELVQMVVRASGKDIPVAYDPSIATSIWGQAVDCRRAKELLGWKAKVALVDGVARYYAHQAAAAARGAQSASRGAEAAAVRAGGVRSER